jgi:hypothetical protein
VWLSFQHCLYFRFNSVGCQDDLWMKSWRRLSKESSFSNRGNMSAFHLEGLRKASKPLSKDSWCTGRDSEREFSEHNSRILSLQKYLSLSFSKNAIICSASK